MRVLFTPHAWSSHHFHQVSLAWACRTAGHEVRVAGQPPVLDAITGSGLIAVPVGGGYDFATGVAEVNQIARDHLGRAPSMSDLFTLPPEVLQRFFETRYVPHVKTAEAVAADLVPFVRDWRPDVIVGDAIVLAAPLAAAAAGVPYVRHLWGPDVMRQVGFPGLGGDVDEWPEGLRRVYEQYGVQPQPDHAVRIIDPTPDSLQFPGVPNRVKVRYVPYNGSGVVPGWLLEDPGRPRVCVTWSTASTQLLGSDSFLVPDILEALSNLDVEVVITISGADRERLGAVPDGVRIAGHLPHHVLLPACDAIVHQGGAGTLLTAAVTGVPQVLVARVMDQTLNAERLAATGAGVNLTEEESDTDGIKSAVSSVLFGDDARPAAGRLRDEILAAPTPAQTVAILEELL